MKEIKDMSFEEIIARILRVKTEDIREQMNKEAEEDKKKKTPSAKLPYPKEDKKEPKKS